MYQLVPIMLVHVYGFLLSFRLVLMLVCCLYKAVYLQILNTYSFD